MLPEKKSEIKRNLHDYVWFVYGAPKIGKSTLVSGFPEPLFIPTEDRLKHLSVYRIPQEGSVKTWDEFLGICREISNSVKNGEFRFKSIVIDTVDNLIKMCQVHVCEKNNAKHITDVPWGKGWDLVADEFFRAINKLVGLGKGVVFIGHSEIQEVEEGIIKISKTVPCLHKKLKPLLNMVDTVANIGFDRQNPKQRMVFLKPTENLEAGNCAVLLSEKIPEGKIAYEDLQKIFQDEEGRENEK